MVKTEAEIFHLPSPGIIADYPTAVQNMISGKTKTAFAKNIVPTPKQKRELAKQSLEKILIEVSSLKPLPPNTFRVGNNFFVEIDLAHHLMTEDIHPLISDWAQQEKFCIPGHDFFHDHFAQLIKQLKEFLQVPVLGITFQELKDKMTGLIKEFAPHDIILTLDRLYTPQADFSIETTKVRHHRKTHQILGTVARPGHPTFFEQIQYFAIRFPKNKAVTIVTDGCWSGSEIWQTYDELLKKGFVVRNVIAGILRPQAFEGLKSLGPQIHYAYLMKLIPWQCERDYTPGVPRSGNNIGTSFGKKSSCDPEDIGIPYFYPFSQDELLADYFDVSLTNTLDLSFERIKATIKLFSEIERLSQKPVYTKDLHRRPYQFPIGKIRLISLLEQVLQKKF